MFLETIKIDKGKAFYLSYHQERMDKTIGVSGKYNLKKMINPPSDSILYRCRIVYDMNSIDISYHPYKKRDIKSLKLIESDIVYDKKYADRLDLDKLFKQRGACDDILIVKDSIIQDTTIANVAFFDGIQWLTPKSPLLNGTTRTRLLKSGFLVEKDIRKDEIYSYKKLALMNAMIDFDIIAEENLKDMIC